MEGRWRLNDVRLKLGSTPRMMFPLTPPRQGGRTEYSDPMSTGFV